MPARIRDRPNRGAQRDRARRPRRRPRRASPPRRTIPRGPSRRPIPNYQRSTAATSASTSSVVLARTMTSSAPAACQRSQVSRGASVHGLPTICSSPSQSPWNPTMTRWSARSPPGRLERLQVERQVRLEVHVEGAPAVADPTSQPRPGRRLAPDDDRRGRVRDRKRGRVHERVERRLARDRTAGPERPDDRDGLLEPGTSFGRFGERHPIGRVLAWRATDPDAQDQPTATGDLERGRHPGDERGMAVHDVEHERAHRHALGLRRRPSRGSSSPRRPARSGRPCP